MANIHVCLWNRPNSCEVEVTATLPATGGYNHLVKLASVVAPTMSEAVTLARQALADLLKDATDALADTASSGFERPR